MHEHPDPAEHSDHAPMDERTVRARRRAVRGISLAMISLGLLLCASLSTTGRTVLGALGLLPAVLGGAGRLRARSRCIRPIAPPAP